MQLQATTQFRQKNQAHTRVLCPKNKYILHRPVWLVKPSGQWGGVLFHGGKFDDGVSNSAHSSKDSNGEDDDSRVDGLQK